MHEIRSDQKKHRISEDILQRKKGFCASADTALSPFRRNENGDMREQKTRQQRAPQPRQASAP